MTAANQSTSNKDASDFPMSTHTSLLGVDIMAHQEAMWADVHEGGHSGGLEPDIEITAWAGDPYFHQHIRKDIAAWARRNLFDGAGPA
jgi:hypothetical protein